MSPSPVINDAGFYLTDGVNGLNIGTGIFNTQGTNKYAVTYIDPLSIGDGVPDIIVPQAGDIPNGADVFYFTKTNNQIVGNSISASFSSIAILARGNWKFYSRTTPTVFGAAGAGARAMRCIAFDFADLGITTSNYTQIAYFIHSLSGNSDQPFVAYNKTSIIILPVRWGKIDVYHAQEEVHLAWETYVEINNKEFVVERSFDMESWSQLATIPSKAVNGNSNQLLNYTFTDENPFMGTNYYRIRQMDWNDNVDYSEIKSVTVEQGLLQVFPNPSNNMIYVSGVQNEAELKLFNLSTQCIYTAALQEKIVHYPISLESFPAGVYLLEIQERNKPRQVYKVIKY